MLFSPNLTVVTHFITFFQKCLLNRLQLIRNYLAGVVVKGPKPSHISAILKPLHWLKIIERIEYKLLSLTL